MANVKHILNTEKSMRAIQTLANAFEANFPDAKEGDGGRVPMKGKGIVMRWDSVSHKKRTAILSKIQRIQDDILTLAKDLRFEEPKAEKKAPRNKMKGRRKLK